MSRHGYQARREAREQWPSLAGFLIAALHRDDDRSVQDDVDVGLAGMSLAQRQQLAREWWDWNAVAGRVDDVRFAIEAFDSGLAFDTADHARTFMNEPYDRVIGTVRRELDERWRP